MIELNLTDNEARLLHLLIINYLSVLNNLPSIDHKKFNIQDVLTLIRLSNNLKNAINLN
jgi:hypothetical protein